MRCARPWQNCQKLMAWALAVRCFIALEDDDKVAAAALYERMKNATHVPQDYLPKLQRAFDDAASNIVYIDFSQMPDGPQIPWLANRTCWHRHRSSNRSPRFY